MRKVVLMMLLAVVSGSAAAEWVKAGSNERGTTYVDPSTIRKAGNMVKMWELLDLTTADRLEGKSFMSVMSQYEYDCKEEKLRLLAISFHSAKMAGGEALHQSGPDSQGWVPVAPGTKGEIFWKFACGKR